MDKHPVEQIAEAVGGTIQEAGVLPDGSGFAIMPMPLPKDHWSTQKSDDYEPPPMKFRMGTREHAVVAIFPNAGYPDRMQHLEREQMAAIIRAAGKYAYRACTMQGRATDIDPDALLQNLVVAMLGYWTADGRSSDDWANPPDQRKGEV